MKKFILLISLLSVSLSISANDPNFNSATGVITFPRVTVDKGVAYHDVRLRLNPDRTWELLSVEPKEQINIAGYWKGTGVSSLFSQCTALIEGDLIQNGNKIEGDGYLNGTCVSGTGKVDGEIIGNNVVFGIAFDNSTTIYFNGTISEDRKTLNGSYSWPDENDIGTWSLRKQ